MKRLFTALALCGALLTACDDDKNTLPPPYENDGEASVWFFKGTIDIKEQSDGSTYTDKDLVVKVVFDEDRKVANIVMYHARFAAAMPVRLDIVISGAHVAERNEGYRITGNNIIPTYNNGVPFEMYNVTGLSVDVNAKSIELSMKCGTFPVTYSGKGHEVGKNEYGDEGEDFTDPIPVEPITPPVDAVYDGIFTVEGSRGEVEDPVKAGLTFDDSGNCKVILYNATFTPGLPAGAGMPRMDIEIDGVKCGLDSEGSYILTGDGIIPVARGMEFEDFVITELIGTISGESLQFSMKCGTTPASYEGKVSADTEE